jgi:hypothetical protein
MKLAHCQAGKETFSLIFLNTSLRVRANDMLDRFCTWVDSTSRFYS